MLTRYKGQLRLKDWAFAIARRSTMRKAAHRSLLRRLAIILHAMLRNGTESSGRGSTDPGGGRPHLSPPRSDAGGREQTAAPILSHAAQPS
jgi:hypothetical protein